MDALWKTEHRLWARLLVGGVAFGAAAVLAAALGAWLAGSLAPLVCVAALVLGAVVAVVAAAAAARRPAEAPFTRWEWLALVAFALVSIRQFGWLVFERDGALLTLLPYNYGDLPLHWTYVQHFASGATFWPDNPILSHERLRYPLGVDLLASVFVRLGAPLEQVLPAIGLAGALLAALALRRWGGAFAVAAFLLSGGVAGLPQLAGALSANPQESLAWKNLFLALLVPQRGFLLALPLALLLLAGFRARLVRGEPPPLPAWLEGLLWGVLPLVHMHSFAFVSLVFACWSVAGGRLRAGLPPLGFALAPATWGVVQVTDGFRTAGLVGWAPGWMIGHDNPLAFLLVNFGLWLPLAIAALVVAARGRRREELALLVPSLAVFALLFFVRLAPWAWDNTKVMLWCYVAMLPALESAVLARLPAAARALALAVLLGGGAASVLWACAGRLPRLEILERAEYAAVCQSLRGLDTDRVATAQTFNHPVALCGRKLVAGYGGHLWSHGLRSAALEAALKRLMLGDPTWRADARELGASHLFWGDREATAFAGSARPWEADGPVALGRWGAIYPLK